MSQTPELNLLRKIQNGDEDALVTLHSRYANLVYSVAFRVLNDQMAAEEVTQDTFMRIWRKSSSFDPEKGRFVTWLLTVTRNELRKMAARKSSRAQASGDTAVRSLLEQEPDEPAGDEQWDREYQWNLFLWAAERVKAEFREATWQAFWRTVVEGQAIEPVAQELKLSTGAVYIARSRVIARIRQEIATVEET